ncbi:hypothetical protein APHAL10511_002927 [Amanita phalloides]|nr:hypothetical protein APHAL10511_002927 [Amanita phalloides]
MTVAAVIQRPLRGSRVSTFYPVKTLPLLSSLDSAFQLQEYISLLIRHNVHDVERIVSLPGKPGGRDKEKDADETADVKNEEKDSDKVKGDVTVDEACWIYEQLRRLAQDLTHPLITMLQQECSRTTCPEMKAGEWLYLCVAHGTDGAMEQCCAIDYILHTLDSATALLNSPRAFPSRLQIPPASHRHFTSLARRLGRIFAHAYFHHRDIFAQAEAESSLYARFLALTTHFDLVPPDFIVVPPTKVITDGESDENDIPRHSTVDREGEYRPSVIVPDPAEVQPPRLLAASLEPQTEREKEKGHAIQHYLSAPTSSSSATAPINPTIRILNNRSPAVTPATNKNRNSSNLFVSNNGLIPLSAAATTAPTTAASLFASSEAHLSTTSVPAFSGVGATGSSAGTSSGLGVEPTLATGQESPRRVNRPRTDTMVYSEGYTGSGNGRGTSPIPIVRLGARLNEPEEKKDLAGSGEKAAIPVAETPVHALVTKESEPLVVEERREETELEKEEPDFVPIDDEMEVINVTETQEGRAAEADEDPPPVSEEEQVRVQTEPEVTLSEPEVEAVPSDEQAQPEEGALSDQGQPERIAVEALSQPSQVEPVHEIGSETVVGQEAAEVAEASDSAKRPDEVVDTPEQGQMGEDTLVDGSSTEAVEHVELENAESSDANVAVEDKEADQIAQQS